MSAVGSRKVELSMGWCGNYSFDNHNVVGVSVFLKCGGDAITARINTQLPPHQTQHLQLRLSEKFSPEHCKQWNLPLWSSSNNNVRMTDGIKCPLHAARTLHKVVIHTLKGAVEEVQVQQAEDLCIDVQPDTLPFKEGQKYQIKVVNENHHLSLFVDHKGEIEVVEEPLLTSEILFQKVAKRVLESNLSMRHQGGDNFTVQGQGNYIQIMGETIEWIKETHSVAAMRRFLKNSNEEILRAALRKEGPMVNVTGHVPRDTAIIYISRLVIRWMKDAYPSMAAVEELKQLMNQAEECYFANNWSGLFAILDGELPQFNEETVEMNRIEFYMSICNLAKRDDQPELLIYAYNRAPEGAKKQKQRMEYTRWLASSFNMKLSLTFAVPLERLGPLNFYSVSSWIKQKLPFVIYGGGKEEEIEEELLAYVKNCSIMEQNTFLSGRQYLQYQELRTEMEQRMPLIYNKVCTALTEVMQNNVELAKAPEEEQKRAVIPVDPQKKNSEQKDKCVIA